MIQSDTHNTRKDRDLHIDIPQEAFLVDQHQMTSLAISANGTQIDIGDIISNDMTNTETQNGNQTLLENRIDFHTHPRSLAIARMQIPDMNSQTKMRTTGALLAVYLNLDDTSESHKPDPKVQPVLETWVNPHTLPNQPRKSDVIAQNLVDQFGQIASQVIYKPLMDRSLARLKEYCIHYRNTVDDERIMFYYNGHGMPLPTPEGSFWVRQRQYNPHLYNGGARCVSLSAETLSQWIGSPCVYVWDCAHAMKIVNAFEKQADVRNIEMVTIRKTARAAGIKVPLENVSQGALAAICTKVFELVNSQTKTPGFIQSTVLPNIPEDKDKTVVDLKMIKLALCNSGRCEDIHFAATGPDEQLPTEPKLPADLFTACLTTPAKAMIRYWLLRNPNVSKIIQDNWEKLPGSTQDRYTPMGEINWIITTVTDTIAWSALPPDQFNKMFRGDVVVASLYRNFMLADRIMRFYGVHPQCSPTMPSTHNHPLWDSLDMEIELCLAQLPRLLAEDKRKADLEQMARRNEQSRIVRANKRKQRDSTSTNNTSDILDGIDPLTFEAPHRIKLKIAGAFRPWSSRYFRAKSTKSNSRKNDYETSSDSDSGSDSDGADYIYNTELLCTSAVGYTPSSFFVRQLRAFDMWLQHTAVAVSQFVTSHMPEDTPPALCSEVPPNIEPPLELPIILQMLLSRKYCINALILLYRFTNLGPWAVSLVTAVGAYSYLTKLLSSRTSEVREILTLIWARLVAVDTTLQPMLLKSRGFEYFIAYLGSHVNLQPDSISEKARVRDNVLAAGAFTLTIMCKDTPEVQKTCFYKHLLDYLLTYLHQPDNGTDERATFRVWILMCLAELWKGYPRAKLLAVTYAENWSRPRQHQSIQRFSGNFDENNGGNTPGASMPFEEILASGINGNNSDLQNVQDLLIQMALHRLPVVRAAAIRAIGTLLEDLPQLESNPGGLSIISSVERKIYGLLLHAASDGSPMVRREVVCVIGASVFGTYMTLAIEVVTQVVNKETQRHFKTQLQNAEAASGIEERNKLLSHKTRLDLLVRLYKALLELSTDAHVDVSLPAQEACDALMRLYSHSCAFIEANLSLNEILQQLEVSRSFSQQQSLPGLIQTTGPGASESLLEDFYERMTESPKLCGIKNMTNDEPWQNINMYPWSFSPNQSSLDRLSQSKPLSETPPTMSSYPLPARSISPVNISTIDQHQRLIYMPSQLSKPEITSTYGCKPSKFGKSDNTSNDEHMEARQKLVEIEQAWKEWCRNELRENICESTLLDWVGAHFTEFDISLFANVNGPLQSSSALVESHERNLRVEQMESSARTTGTQVSNIRWMDMRAVASNRHPASVALLHPLEPHAIVASNKGTVSVYDWDLAAQVGHYSIGSQGNHSEASLISSLHLVNPLGHSKLLVGTRDGKVRIFSSHVPDFDPPESSDQTPVFPQPRLVTAFTALPWASLSAGTASSAHPLQGTTLAQNTRLKAHQSQQQHSITSHLQGSVSPLLSASEPNCIFAGAEIPGEQEECGLVTAWNQRSSVLFAGGNDKEVRVWDVAAEMCIEEIPVVSMGGITCVSHDGVSGNIFAVGNADGLVRVMDRRLDARSSAVASWREHSPNAIRNVAMRPGQAEVISASSNGGIKYWDLRHSDSVFTIVDTHTGCQLEHMISHQNMPVLMTTSNATVKLWDQRGNNLGEVSATKQPYGSLKKYIKTLAGYSNQPKGDKIYAAAMHSYLPMALIVTENGNVNCIWPSKANSLSST
ncbi:Target of rapamycin complex 1 subunit kog1 [Coemansia sp. RSA 1365]|nr:Target of rapamycin complex 1 subunit kog1 [Coemansia sp. RSA 1365]